MKNRILKKQKTIRCSGELLSLEKPIVMGILNATPDSFFDGGRYENAANIEQQVKKMIDEGVDILDVGAYSSRPGADDVSALEEWARLDSALSVVREVSAEIPVSVDTFRADVAQKAIDKYNICMVNDISGGMLDAEMFDIVARNNVAYVLMHMPGNPKTMQSLTNYDDVIAEISLFFSKQLEKLRFLGVADVILDPGFGFGKTLEQNYLLLQRLSEFKVFELPVLAGLSRKSMFYKLLDSTPEKMLNATSVANTVALMRGASVLRVHDVQAAKEVVKIVSKLKEQS